MSQHTTSASNKNIFCWLNEATGEISLWPQDGWTLMVPSRLLKEAQGSTEWYRRRCEQLQQHQSNMRDPERTIVCDILANGQLLQNGKGQLEPARYGHMVQGAAEKEVFQGHRHIDVNSGIEGWQPIATAPKDRPILAWCEHAENAYFEEDGERLTAYGANCEGLSHAPDGPAIVVWGEEFTEGSHEEGYFTMPAWWFVAGTDFEVAANPTHWKEVDLTCPGKPEGKS